MVLFTVWAGSVASGWATSSWEWLHAMVGTLLVAASGSAVNQYLERYTDYFMKRTAQRPLPGGKLSAPEVVTFAAVTLGVGIAYLLATVHPIAAGLCFATWVLYAFVYTMSKPLTVWNTFIGAFPGAMPVLVGAAAFDGTIKPLSWILFLILFWWQFPHFMAIAWKYRQDYAEGGLKMITVTDPSGRMAGLIAVGVSIVLLLTSLVAVVWLSQPMIYALAAVILGGGYIWYSWKFFRDRSELTSRPLLLASLVYLPLQMIALLSCM
jgi:protoheme IX farnesyltransferase